MLVRILTISNLLSVLRAPLAILFLFASQPWRILILALAALSDWLDGFIARRWGKPTTLGAVLDPVMDKFFMLFVFSVLVVEGALGGWEMVAMLSRDIVLLSFVAFVAATGTWRTMKPRSLIWGKVSTIAQYVYLFVIAFGVAIPWPVFLLFPAFAALYLGELVVEYRRK